MLQASPSRMQRGKLGHRWSVKEQGSSAHSLTHLQGRPLPIDGHATDQNPEMLQGDQTEAVELFKAFALSAQQVWGQRPAAKQKGDLSPGKPANVSSGLAKFVRDS